VTYGLCKGSSDLIGLRQVLIGPEHLGQTLAVFTAIEVKAPGGRLREEQRSFLSLVERFGGYCGVARSTAEAARVLRREGRSKPYEGTGLGRGTTPKPAGSAIRMRICQQERPRHRLHIADTKYLHDAYSSKLCPKMPRA